jgi:hypothetical protein
MTVFPTTSKTSTAPIRRGTRSTTRSPRSRSSAPGRSSPSSASMPASALSRQPARD